MLNTLICLSSSIKYIESLRNIGCDEEAKKYECDGRMEFYLVFGELVHYLMTMESGPQNCGGIVHSGRVQMFPPQNMGPIQVFKNIPQLVG